MTLVRGKIMQILESDPKATNGQIADDLNTHPSYVSMVRNMSGRAFETCSDKIRRIIREEPALSNKDISLIVGCTPALVSQVRTKAGLKMFSSKSITKENTDFIASEAAKSGVTFDAMINAIITDARMEAEA